MSDDLDRLAEAYAENERKRRECPNRDQHMERPSPYPARDWSQVACPGCGLFVIWIPR